MFKRTWIVIISMLVMGVLLSACGANGDLAEDLTPIPTLPPGEEPELVDALQAGAEPAADDGSEALDQEQLVALGKETFGQCAGCHGAQDGAGPALTGMGARAATRVEGMSAEDYLHEAIVDPGAHVVEGFSNIMPGDYGESLSEQEIQGLIAYILTQAGDADEMAAEEPTEAPTAEVESTEESQGDESAAAAGDAANGEALFVQSCASCHQAEASVGPALTGMGERAATRVEGMSAEEYLHEAIVDPGAHIVEGFSNIMPPVYGEQFDEQQLADLVAYLLSQ